MKITKQVVFFEVFGIAGFLFAVAAYPSVPAPWLRIFWSSPFLTTAQIVCGIGLVLLILRWITRRPLPQAIIKVLFGIIFLPILILPVFRCFFKVPYVFCRSCPDPCPWGLARTTFFSSFILLNLFGKFWCTSCCPFGTFQECQTQVSPKRIKIPSWITALSYISLFLVAGMYLLALAGSKAVGFFELGRYEWVGTTVLVAFVILVLAFFIPKCWCRYFCPVGTIAELTALFHRPSQPSKPPCKDPVL